MGFIGTLVLAVFKFVGFLLKTTFVAAILSIIIWIAAFVFRNNLDFGSLMYNTWWAVLIAALLWKILRFLTGKGEVR